MTIPDISMLNPKCKGGLEGMKKALICLDLLDNIDETNNMDATYAIKEINNLATMFLFMDHLIDSAPTLKNTKKQLIDIEKCASSLKQALSLVTNWTAISMHTVMSDTEKEEICNNPLYKDFPRPDDLNGTCNGAASWQASLDILSSWAGKAAHSIGGLSDGGPLKMANLVFGNTKEQLVIGCSRLLFTFNIEHGYTRKGPLSRLVKSVHYYANAREGSGWEDIIENIKKWRDQQESFNLALGSLHATDYILSKNPKSNLNPSSTGITRNELISHAVSRVVENGNLFEGPHALRERIKLHRRKKGEPDEK